MKLEQMIRKKPDYRYAIWDSKKKCFIKFEKKLLIFEFPNQCENWIERKLKGSKAYSMVDMRKVKK
jgi:hypothetical protein